MKPAAPLLVLIAAGAVLGGMSLPASAGTVYRCDAADGTRSYASSPVKGSRCKSVGSYTDAPPKRAAPAAVVAAAPVAAAGPAVKQPAAPRPAATPRIVQGQVYSYIKDGVRHYTSKRPKGGDGATAMRTISYSFVESCYACTASKVDFGNVRLNTSAYQAEVAAAAREYGVDEAVVRAIIHAESAFNPKALSRVGAQGLMQLMPATAERFGVSNAFDASQNIRGGVKYLAWLLKRFDGNLTLAAAGYNAGEGAVDKYDGVPPYKETQRYVQRVGVLAERYRGALAAR
ncbi:MAG TPA: lytic transglycosylase domain-containing protein [Xanthomonadaceae bacterium]|nr:lytic transglycosylase domain-containing protein [Xanthomonadaceae bacterium]